MPDSIEWQAARFMTEVAAALEKIDGKTTYGEFYVAEARIGFDGDGTGLRIIPNEHGGYDLIAEPSSQRDGDTP